MSNSTAKPHAVRAFVALKLKEHTKKQLDTDYDYLIIRVFSYALPRNTGKHLYKYLNEYDQILRMLKLGHRNYLDFGTKDYKKDLLDEGNPDQAPLLCNLDFLEETAPYLVSFVYIFEDGRWTVLRKGERYVISSAVMEDLLELEELAGYKTPEDVFLDSLSPNQRFVVDQLMRRHKINIKDLI